jgi:hypothetical protein
MHAIAATAGRFVRPNLHVLGSAKCAMSVYSASKATQSSCSQSVCVFLTCTTCTAALQTKAPILKANTEAELARAEAELEECRRKEEELVGFQFWVLVTSGSWGLGRRGSWVRASSRATDSSAVHGSCEWTCMPSCLVQIMGQPATHHHTVVPCTLCQGCV